jgi:hypothetical protein
MVGVTTSHDDRPTVRERWAAATATGGWGEVGSDWHPRYAKPNPTNRRHCLRCMRRQHLTRASHTGFANGVALMTGCEFHVTQWVRSTRG